MSISKELNKMSIFMQVHWNIFATILYCTAPATCVLGGGGGVYLSPTFYILIYFVVRGGADVHFSQHFYIFIHIPLLVYICIYCAGRRQCLFVPNFLASPLHRTPPDSPFAATQSLLITFFFSGCHFLKSVDWNSCFILRIFKVSRKMNLYCVQKHLL